MPLKTLQSKFAIKSLISNMKIKWLFEWGYNSMLVSLIVKFYINV